MTLFNKILFAVDLSEASKKIVPYVKEAIEKFGADLHVFHAMHTREYYVDPSLAMAYSQGDDVDPEIKAEVENRIREFIESHLKGLSFQPKILPGPPGPEIIKYAEEEGIDLIIMGHSSTGIARAVFGSVAAYVVKHSHVPVLIISPSILKNKI